MKTLRLLLAIATLGLALIAGCSQSSSYPSAGGASSPAASPTPRSGY